MEWRNDILSFSGFDYGASLDSNKCDIVEDVEKSIEVLEISDDEEMNKTSGDIERVKYLRTTYISSLSDEVSTCDTFEKTAIELDKPILSIEDMVEKQEEQEKEREKLKLDVLDERSVENLYFRNVEQAEKKMSTIVQLKNKWQRMTENGEMVDRSRLKPICQQNPWKFEKQYAAIVPRNNQSAGSYKWRCVIS